MCVRVLTSHAKAASAILIGLLWFLRVVTQALLVSRTFLKKGFALAPPNPTGGSNPVFDEVVLSLSLMNEVISVDEVAGSFLKF